MIDVSVLTPSLGYGRFLEDNILSVLGQEGLSVQHIIQDGGSTDETLAVLARFDEVIDWSSEPDRGQSDALNKALRRAKGRWVAWLNADEFYLPGGLAALVRHGDETFADVVYSENVFVDEEGRVSRLVGQHRFSRSALWYGCFIASSSAIFRRTALPSEPWDAHMRRIMDWELYLKLVTLGAHVSYIKYPVGAFRWHDERATATPSKDSWDEYSTLFARYGISPATRRRGLRLHRAYKLSSGAYWRQLRAHRFRGHDLRWFRGETPRATFESLLGACYRRRSGLD